MSTTSYEDSSVIDLTSTGSEDMHHVSGFDVEPAGHSNDEEGGWDGEGDWSDDEDTSSSDGWKATFEMIVAEDEERIKRKRQQNQDTVSAASTAVSPSGSEDWSESPVCEELGSVKYVHGGQECVAMQTRAGGLVYEGRRFRTISEWLRTAFNRRI